MTRDQALQYWSSNPNVRLLANLISQTEGASKASNPYLSRGGDNTNKNMISDISRHPGYAPDGKWAYTDVDGVKKFATAHGRYGFNAPTWRDIERRWGAMDFSPESQNAAFVYKLGQTGQLQNVINGKWGVALPALRSTWSSLPGGRHTHVNNEQVMAMLRNSSPDDVYSSAGGITQSAPLQGGVPRDVFALPSVGTAENPKPTIGFVQQMLQSPYEAQTRISQFGANIGDQHKYLTRFLTKPL